MLDKFITCINKGQDLVLSTIAPYPLGQPVFYTSPEIQAYQLSVTKPVFYASVPGYNITLNWAGTIAGNKIQLRKETTEFLQQLFNQMAQYYLEEIIYKNESRFEPYLKD